MIQVRIRKHYPPGPDSCDFTLELDFLAGRGVTVLFGPSGSGKTLTLDAIAGFVRPDEGRILLDDEILFDSVRNVHVPPRARRCGYVFQNYALFPHMTLRKNLEFAAAKHPRLARHRRVNEMLERFRLTDVGGRLPHEVSGGQKQRCSIARALIGEPRLLLLDEPARGLDAPLKAELYSALNQVRAEFGTPVLLVTHDLEECLELGEEMLILREGRLAQMGTPRDIVEQPASVEVARLLGLYNLLAAEVKALNPARNTSLLRLDGCDLEGPYLPRHLIGDRVWLYVRPDQLRVLPADVPPAPNRFVAQLTGVSQRAGSVRLHFEGGFSADLSLADYTAGKSARGWTVEFPRDCIRLI